MKNAGVASVPLAAGRSRAVGDFLALAKPRLNFLVVLTSAGGYYLGAASALNPVAMAAAVAGTALVAGGAAALNQVYERDTDGLMPRTRTRPLPDGRVSARDATIFGLTLSAMGVITLALAANMLSAALAVATISLYLLVYTPMKRRTSSATVVGAIPGALPPVIGWTAAHGSVALGGLVLFGIVFFWQIPHFMAIAWMYRDEYKAAGFPLLPVVEPDGRKAGHQAVLYSAALLPASLAPSFVGISGTPYFWMALPLSALMLALAVRFASMRTELAARQLFFGSITYLPIIWVALVVFH